MRLNIKNRTVYLITGLILALFAWGGNDRQVSGQENQNQNAESGNPELLKQLGLKQPEHMMFDWLLTKIDEKQVEWEENYEKVKTEEDIKAYQQARIDFFKRNLGQFWEKTPLNPQVTGTIDRGSFRIENIIFESCPNFYVSGTMFLPAESKFKAPYPVVLVVCGHSTNGKAMELYQSICILAAVNGLAAFIMDPVDQGERLQHLNPDGKPYTLSVGAHNIIGGTSILLGRNTATFEIWDMTRALDYLQSRPDIQGDKIGVCGTSGGGTQSSYLMALDERILAAAPSCYICNMFDNLTHVLGPQDAEQNIFNQIGFGMDHADYGIMRAPKPTLICTVTHDFFFVEDGWKSFRYMKRIYTRLFASERVEITEKDSEHGYATENRVATIRWMLRWLAGRDEAINEHNEPLFTDEELKSVKNGDSVLALPEARTTYDLNRDLEAELLPKRAQIWSDIKKDGTEGASRAAKMVRELAGIRNFDELPAVKVHETDSAQNFAMETDSHIFLPVRTNFAGDEKMETVTLVIGDTGRFDDRVNELFDKAAENRENIAAVELRGWGESQNKGQTYYAYSWFGLDGSDYYLAYLLGKSYIGLRCDDLILAAHYFQEKYGVKIRLVALGLAGTVAVHAAVAEPELFDSVTIDSDLPNWHTWVENAPCPIVLTNTIHGVLNYYDIEDLKNFLSDNGKLTVR